MKRINILLLMFICLLITGCNFSKELDYNTKR